MKQSVHSQEIELLLKRYFDGLTSNAEEQRLYQLFQSETLPPHLEVYRPVIDYLSAGIQQEFLSEKKVSLPLYRRSFGWIKGCVAVAALLLLLFGLRSRLALQAFDPLEGSYIVRNGQVIKDLDQIRPHLLHTMQQVEEMELMAEQMNRRADELAVSIERRNELKQLKYQAYENKMHVVHTDRSASRDVADECTETD